MLYDPSTAYPLPTLSLVHYFFSTSQLPKCHVILCLYGFAQLSLYSEYLAFSEMLPLILMPRSLVTPLATVTDTVTTAMVIR